MKRVLLSHRWSWQCCSLLQSAVNAQWASESAAMCRRCASTLPNEGSSRTSGDDSADAPVSADVAALHQRWDALAALVRQDRDPQQMILLVDQTVRVAESCAAAAKALFDPHRSVTCKRMWFAVMKFRCPRQRYARLLQLQMTHLHERERRFVAFHSKRRPFLAPTYLYLALTRLPLEVTPVAELGAPLTPAQEDELVRDCYTWVQVVQAVRRFERQGALGESDPLIVHVRVLRHVWSVARKATVRDAASRELLLALLLRLRLIHVSWTDRALKRKLLEEQKLAILDATGSWSAVLSLFDCARSVVNSKEREAVRSYVHGRTLWWRCLQEMDTLSDSKSAVLCVSSAPSWHHALYAVHHTLCAATHASNEFSAFRVLAYNALVERSDTPWNIAIAILAHSAQHARLHRVLGALRKTTPPFDIAHLVRILDAFQRSGEKEQKFLYQNHVLCVATAWECIHSANVTEVGDLSARQEPPPTVAAAANEVRVATTATTAKRWDLAIALLVAGGCFDIALPIAEYAQQQNKCIPAGSSIAPTTENSASSVSTWLLPQSSEGDQWRERGIVVAGGALSTVGGDSALLLHLCQRQSQLGAKVCDGVMQTTSLRTQTLYSALRWPRNPFTKWFHGCYVFQSETMTRRIFDTATRAQRAAFVGALKSARGPAGHALRRHCLGLTRALDHSMTTGAEPADERSGDAPLTNLEAQRLLRAVASQQHAAVADSAALEHVVDALRCAYCSRPLAALLLRLAYLMSARAIAVPPHVIALALLRGLWWTGDAHVAPSTVLAIASCVTAEELRGCPLASVVAAKSFACCRGKWESALSCLNVDPQQETLKLRKLLIHEHERLQWCADVLAVACALPTAYSAVTGRHHRHGAGLRVVHRAFQSPGLVRPVHRQLLRALVPLWRGSGNVTTDLLRLLHRCVGPEISKPDEEGSDLGGGPSTLAARRISALIARILLGCALCRLHTKAQLLPIAKALSRPLVPSDVLPVAFVRVVAALPWEQSLSILSAPHIRGSPFGCSEEWYIAVLQPHALPDAVLHAVGAMAAQFQWFRLHSLAFGELCLRARDVTHGLRYLETAVATYGADVRARMLLRILTSITVAWNEGWPMDATDALRLWRFSHRLAEEHHSSILRQIRLATHLVRLDACSEEEGAEDAAPPMTAPLPPPRTACGMHNALQMLTALTYRVSRAEQVPMQARFLSNGLALASDSDNWCAALYFFQALQHPLPQDLAAVCISLRNAPERMVGRCFQQSHHFQRQRADVRYQVALFRELVAHCDEPPSETNRSATWIYALQTLCQTQEPNLRRCFHVPPGFSLDDVHAATVRNRQLWALALHRLAQHCIEVAADNQKGGWAASLHLSATELRSHVVLPVVSERVSFAAAVLLAYHSDKREPVIPLTEGDVELLEEVCNNSSEGEEE